MKKCCICKTDKPHSEFNQKAKAKDGLQEACKDCNRARSKAHYQANKQKYFDRVRQSDREKTKEIQDLKSRTPCKDCGGIFHFAAMDFDHIADKLFNIGGSGYRKSRKALKAEIAKCDLVCSNCHRVRTYNRIRMAQSSTG